MAPDEASYVALMRVTVVWSSAPRSVNEVQLLLPAGATLADALRAAAPGGNAAWAGMQASLWGRAALADQVLRDRDRVELCRALQVDPKTARRERFRSQGVRTAGLFSRQRTEGGEAHPKR